MQAPNSAQGNRVSKASARTRSESPNKRQGSGKLSNSMHLVVYS
jgi:hypothetical protein